MYPHLRMALDLCPLIGNRQTALDLGDQFDEAAYRAELIAAGIEPAAAADVAAKTAQARLQELKEQRQWLAELARLQTEWQAAQAQLESLSVRWTLDSTNTALLTDTPPASGVRVLLIR